MKLFLIILAIVAMLIVAGLWLLAQKSQTPPILGLHDGNLLPCTNLTNCVNTMQVSLIDLSPISYQGDDEAAMKNMEETLTSLGGKIEKTQPNYLWATFKSRFFGFIDDVEVKQDTDNKWFNIRSASRVGRSDLSVNRLRVEKIRKALNRG